MGMCVGKEMGLLADGPGRSVVRTPYAKERNEMECER